MAAGGGYHVLTKEGDSQAEVEKAVREIGAAQDAGLHRFFFVSRADQTVVMTRSPNSPIARVLRERPGWEEPGEGA